MVMTVVFPLIYFSFPDAATKGQTGLTFANATTRDIYIKVTTGFPKIRKSQKLWGGHLHHSTLDQSVTYRYREFPIPGIFHFFWWYRNRYRKNLVPEKSLGTGIGKIWYRKKVSEPVSEKVGTEKSTGIGIENIWYRKKVSVSVSFNILGTVTHWSWFA